MCWNVELYPLFAQEFLEFSEAVQDALLAEVALLEKYGPQLNRPHVDTLNGSKHINMKELRFKADNGVWRAAFAFDPKRQAILLVAGDKSGMSEKRFYKQLIKKADERFDNHLTQLKEENQ
ncbi:type II toxin-antitoxin system RelE/ParE family toxin [Scytonema sp. NUACC26]|uniref:type II toxin-antitoxin system RelE/ParE family toxin n=1 Tax=Scytonema sp. NUACC26 TaxID=3140176 RepID=UPI0034DC5378